MALEPLLVHFVQLRQERVDFNPPLADSFTQDGDVFSRFLQLLQLSQEISSPLQLLLPQELHGLEQLPNPLVQLPQPLNPYEKLVIEVADPALITRQLSVQLKN